ncbi:PD-(D/E)XK nuclease family protein [Aquabacterium sp.]|uniref:PD-(D/E)XK nuclease family protein n=1 Tax=Aquabacterium sp. TaxID=1872578 RepID=UPI002C224814|nr:PD-(D/E)XK nuclease family protein [Aquabacterium sp.]HSW07676.1 PD-(D/E)XK nuclease family protein [Aquabacterium sp.]
MATIDQIHLSTSLTPAELWRELPCQAQAWMQGLQLPARDAVFLLPFAELLPLARQAFAEQGGWQPRIETVQTLAGSLGPAPDPAAGAPSGDLAIDRLLAAGLLGSVAGVNEWRRRDPAAFDQAVDDVVQATHALLRGACAQAPQDRAAWWTQARVALEATIGPGAVSQSLTGALARLALEWAALGGDVATDRLFDLRPSAWLLLSAGGDDALAGALLHDAAQRGTPVLVLAADAAPQALFQELPPQAPRLWRAIDAETEALAAATAVIQALQQGLAPVALVAEDRLRVRRVRALLERAGVVIADESGWTLSTTRAAAHVMALLRAAHPAANADAHLDGLKAEAGPDEAGWIDVLEAHWRRGGAPDARHMRLLRALERWEICQARWRAFAVPRRQSLAAWLQALRQLLIEGPSAQRWSSDAAARAVWQALRLDSASARSDVDATLMGFDEFTAWVDAALAAGSYIPAIDRDAAQVLITPLARAMLRPFGAVVLPGADERTLGPPPPAPALLGEALLRAIGMPDREARARRAVLGFAQLLRHPQLLLVRRLADGDEHLGPSPWVARLQLARHAQGLSPLPEIDAPLAQQCLQAAPVYPPKPSAAGALPNAVSASAVEALRTCPYRFYARSVLRLTEVEELALDPGKRDFGSLLHAVLQRFHDERTAGRPPAEEHQRLLALADEVAAESQLDGPAMLPFRAGMPAFAQRYLQWLAQRDAQGWRYAAGELDKTCLPDILQGLQLRGRIDRLDRHDSGELQVIDYKTGSLRSLQAKVKQPLEDTQLAFYAAQMLCDEELPPALSAGYVALDEREAITDVPHPDVVSSAQALLAGLADEWARLGQGTPLLALGEGMACEFCEARGLCRRDHWSNRPDDDPA